MQLPYHFDETCSRSASQPMNPQLLPSPHLDSPTGHLQDVSSPWLAAPSPLRHVRFTLEGFKDGVMHESSCNEDFTSTSSAYTFQQDIDLPDLMDSSGLHRPSNEYDWMAPSSPLLTHSEMVARLPRTPPPRPLRPYHCAISRDSSPPSRLQRSRPLPILAPGCSSPATIARNIWPSPVSSAGEAEQSPGFPTQLSSPRYISLPLHFLEASGDLRTALTLTTSDLRMSKSAQITCFEEYLANQPESSANNVLEVCTSRDILDHGETMQNTFQHIKCFLHRFSEISISLRVEPDSPDPTGLGLIFDAIDHSGPGATIDLEDAVNLKEFTWRGSALSLTKTITGLPKHSITRLRITDCQISLRDAAIIVKSFPNLEHLEIDMIDDHADNVLHLSPLLSPTLARSSRIDHLKITSSAPLQGFLQDIGFLDSNTRVKSILLIPYGIRDDILPDIAYLENLTVRSRK